MLPYGALATPPAAHHTLAFRGLSAVIAATVSQDSFPSAYNAPVSHNRVYFAPLTGEVPSRPHPEPEISPLDSAWTLNSREWIRSSGLQASSFLLCLVASFMFSFTFLDVIR